LLKVEFYRDVPQTFAGSLMLPKGVRFLAIALILIYREPSASPVNVVLGLVAVCLQAVV